MPSQEVIESLQKLHDELNKLEPAIKHVETAVEVTKNVKSIPDKHLELIDLLKDIDFEFKNNLKDIFEKEVENIRKGNLGIIDEINNLISVLTGYHEKLSALKDQMEEYYKRTLSINFPERLDKIDNNISAINIGIQNIQTRINDFERQVLRMIEDLEHRQKRGNTINIILLIVILSMLISVIIKVYIL